MRVRGACPHRHLLTKVRGQGQKERDQRVKADTQGCRGSLPTREEAWTAKPPPHQSETLCLMLAGVRKGLRQPGEALQL